MKKNKYVKNKKYRLKQEVVEYTRKYSVRIKACAERYAKIKEEPDLKLNKRRGLLGAGHIQLTSNLWK